MLTQHEDASCRVGTICRTSHNVYIGQSLYRTPTRDSIVNVKDLAGVHDALRVEHLLHLPHEPQLRRAPAEVQKLLLQQADAVLGADAALPVPHPLVDEAVELVRQDLRDLSASQRPHDGRASPGLRAQGDPMF